MLPTVTPSPADPPIPRPVHYIVVDDDLEEKVRLAMIRVEKRNMLVKALLRQPPRVVQKVRAKLRRSRSDSDLFFASTYLEREAAFI